MVDRPLAVSLRDVLGRNDAAQEGYFAQALANERTASLGGLLEPVLGVQASDEEVVESCGVDCFESVGSHGHCLLLG